MSFHVPEQFRVLNGRFASDGTFGNNGAFRVRLQRSTVLVIASDGMGWEHVSVSHPTHTPIWAEMCEVKAVFWDAEDLVVQYHPPQSSYVNRHKFCLHLWRPTDAVFPRPPRELVG